MSSDTQRGPKHDEKLARMAEHVENMQKQHPESDFNVGAQWWVPSINLSTDLENNLDPVTADKLNVCMAKLFERKFAPEAITEVRNELKTILAEHPDMLGRMDESIFRNEQALASVHQFASAEEAAGRDVFACPAMKK